MNRILAIELFNGAQALEFRKLPNVSRQALKSSNTIEKIVADYRKIVPFVEEDKIMYPEIEKSVQFLKQTQFVI